MLEACGLYKWYSGVPVLNGLSFTLKGCEITGYLGPNGAGKSTTAKTLTGLLHPSEGQVLWNGQNIRLSALRYEADALSAVEPLNLSYKPY